MSKSQLDFNLQTLERVGDSTDDVFYIHTFLTPEADKAMWEGICCIELTDKAIEYIKQEFKNAGWTPPNVKDKL